MKQNIVLGLTHIGCALLIIGVCVPLVQGRIKMNRWYGVRLRKSFESEENWYKLNAFGGRQLILWSLPLIAAGLLCFFIPFAGRNKDVLALVLGTAPLLVFPAIAIIRIYQYAKTL